MKARIFLLTLLLPLLCFAELATKSVLAIDTNKDGTVNEVTIKQGEDFMLVKNNPSKLKPTDMVLQTKNYNVYTAANTEDLTEPNAYRKIFIAKILQSGMIKVYTLANMGYTSLQIEKNGQGQDEVFLVGAKNSLVKIHSLSMQALPVQVYKAMAKKSRPLTGR